MGNLWILRIKDTFSLFEILVTFLYFNLYFGIYDLQYMLKYWFSVSIVVEVVEIFRS